jgi:hypothetical protein
MELDQTGSLQFTKQRAVPELTLKSMDDQSNLFTDFAASQGMHYLNLTSIFQEEAGKGTELYYPIDTHWNQRGHDLAAEAIAQYLAENRK